MADRVGAFFPGDPDLFLGDQGARDGRSKQVMSLVYRIGAECGENEIARKLLAQVYDARLDGAGCQRLFLNAVKLFALAEVGRKSHHFALVSFDEPLENNRCVKSSGIGQYDFLDTHFHNSV